MQTERTTKLFEFEALGRRAVVACFDGGDITSNAGGLLLSQVDRGLGLICRFAQCFRDRRDPRYVEHQVETLVGQRIFGLALGYEDLNDHDELRKDPTFMALAGKLEPVLRSDCEALAGKSTLNRLEHTPKRHGAKYHKIDCDQAQVDRLLVDLFLEAHERPPREIVLDLDNTDIPLHGMQEGRFYNGHYDEYCYLPLYIRSSRHPAAGRQLLAEHRRLQTVLMQGGRVIGFFPSATEAQMAGNDQFVDGVLGNGLRAGPTALRRVGLLFPVRRCFSADHRPQTAQALVRCAPARRRIYFSIQKSIKPSSRSHISTGERRVTLCMNRSSATWDAFNIMPPSAQ